MEKDEVDPVALVEVLDGDLEQLEHYIDTRELSKYQLETILEAEKVHRDREDARELLEQKVAEAEIDDRLEEAEEELGNAVSLLKEIDQIQDFQKAVETEQLERRQLLELAGGTVDDIKSFVESQKPSREVLEELLEAEKLVKNRKTAEGFLERKIEELEASQDLEKVEREAEQLEQDVEQVEQQLSGVELRTGGMESPDNSLLEAMKQVAHNAWKERHGEEEPDKGGEQEGETGEQEKQDDEEQGQDEDEAMEDGHGEQDEAGDEDEMEEEKDGSDEDDGMEQKREILDELDVEMSDQQLRQVSMEELERLKREKEEQEELIDQLGDGFDEEVLRNASLGDLKKIRQEKEQNKEETGGRDKEGEEQREKQELEEEAEEDLKMLMGAVGKEEEEKEEDSSQLDQIKEFRDRVREIFNRGGEEEGEERINKEKVLELLDEYRNIDSREGLIKTAHIMKGYLEYRNEIERELTYKELAQEIDSGGNKDLEELLQFFKKMHRDEYTGRLEDVDAEPIIDTSERVVKAID